MKSVAQKFVDFLNEGFGKRAAQYLKDGASFKFLVGSQTFSLSKSEGKLVLNLGAPEKHDVLIEFSPSAIEYLSSAKTEDESIERLGDVVHHPTRERYARMRIEAEPTEKGRTDFYWKGYFFWARRMAFFA